MAPNEKLRGGSEAEKLGGGGKGKATPGMKYYSHKHTDTVLLTVLSILGLCRHIFRELSELF